MKFLYIEFFYHHPVWEMLLWGVGLVLLWTVLSIILCRWPAVWKQINCFLFFAAFSFIVWRTVGNRSGGKREICLIPFYSFIAARSSSERYRSLVANILLFTPLGLTLPFCIKQHPIRYAILAASVFSVLIELIQFIFGLGLCEIDDVFFNTLGAACGTSAFLLLRCLNHDNNR